MSNDSVVVLITWRAQPGLEDVAMRELAALISTVVASEPDCSGITMLQDAGDPTRILLHELWTSKDAYLGPHMHTPHLQSFVERSAQFIAGAPEITFWKTVTSV